MIYKEESLEALKLFFEKNCPHPAQSKEKTRKLLEEHMNAFCDEVNENLSKRKGLRARMYTSYVLSELYLPDFLEYAEVVSLALDPSLVNWRGDDAARMLERYAKRGYKLEHIYKPDDTPRSKKIKLGKTIKNVKFWEDQNELARSYVKSCYSTGRKSFLPKKEPDGLSTILMREHEEIFLDSITQPLRENIQQEILDTDFMIHMICRSRDNMQTEIDKNFFSFPSGITRPYLLHLLQKFQRQLEQDWRSPSIGFPASDIFLVIDGSLSPEDSKIVLGQFRYYRISSLGYICQQLKDRLEMQDQCLAYLEATREADTVIHKDHMLLSPYFPSSGHYNIEFNAEDLRSFEFAAELKGDQFQEILDQARKSSGWFQENQVVNPRTRRKWSGISNGDYESLWFNLTDGELSRTCHEA